MASWHVISPRQHAGFGWKSLSTYSHTRSNTLVPALQIELGHLLAHYPLAFTKISGDDDGSDAYQLQAVLSLLPQSNAYLNAQGIWAVSYVPASLRQYPFSIIKAPDESLAVCIDVDSGALQSADEPGVKAFFDAQGTTSSDLKELIFFLRTVYNNQIKTDELTAQLAQADVLQPWELAIEKNGRSTPVKGLYRIDMEKINALSATELHALNASGAMALAYAQHLSEPRVDNVKQAMKAQELAPTPLQLDEEFIKGGVLNFASLR